MSLRVIEDDAAILRHLQDMLMRRDYQVMIARVKEDAANRREESKSDLPRGRVNGRS